MYIKKVVLDNIRCFEHVEFDLTSPDGVKKWCMLLGDNGVGKTSVLRSIAMGLCDKTRAAALLSELYGEWVRLQNPKEPGVIYLELLGDARGKEKYWIRTRVHRDDAGETYIEQDTHPKTGFPWDDIFVCGYGPGRGWMGTKSVDEFSVVDAVLTLFDYTQDLLNAELSIRRLGDPNPEIRDDILRWIDEILMLPAGSTQLSRAGITLSGPWGKSVQLHAVGDGYQATLAWVMDMLYWALLYDADMYQSGLTGIVLLDEIEQHLHPRWQKTIVSLLKERLPGMQFITTTHSALCAIGTTDLTDANCELLVLSQQGDRSELKENFPPPRGQRADQVLTSYLFGLPTSGDDETVEEIEKYSKLLKKPTRTDEEEHELVTLQGILDAKLGSGETTLEQVVSQAIRKCLRNMPEVTNFDAKALDYETRRQLRNLLE